MTTIIFASILGLQIYNTLIKRHQNLVWLLGLSILSLTLIRAVDVQLNHIDAALAIATLFSIIFASPGD